MTIVVQSGVLRTAGGGGDTTTGLVSYWPMNDSPDLGFFADSQPGSHTGSTTGLMIGGDHMNLDGSQLGTVGDHADFTFGAAMSAFLWVKGATQASKRFFAHAASDGDISWILSTDTGTGDKIRVGLSTDGTSLLKHYVGSQTALDGTNWKSIAFTFSGSGSGTLKLYVNGAPDSSPTLTTDSTCNSLKNCASNLSFGALFLTSPSADPSGFFTGDMRKVRLYNTAKTDADILAIHNLG